MVEQRPNLRMLIAPARSGTTAFLHTIAQHQLVDTATGAMKTNLKSGGYLNYNIYDAISVYPFLFYKATLGTATTAECTYNPFRSKEDVNRVKPLFLIRDPLQTFNSWKKMNWGSIDLFILAYQNALTLYKYASNASPYTRCVTYEHLANNPERIFKKLLWDWDIPFDENIFIWRTNLGNDTIKYKKLDDWRAKLIRDIKRGFHKNLLEGEQRFYMRQESDLVLLSYEKEKLNNLFREKYDFLRNISLLYYLQEEQS